MRAITNIFSALVLVLGAVCLSAAIWVGLPILGIPFLAGEAIRFALIGLALLLLFTVTWLRGRARKRAAEALERSLLASSGSDGAVLAERMHSAVSRLKQTGGKTALYDLPWYVIIGPPGAGKTTALVHSGLEFPGTDPAAVAGVGGTRNCDFWFARDAVLIDTAGRYTTQDSDAQADSASWAAFLQELKGARPDQPINGVILALSCSDLMTAGEPALQAHADTVRARLSEVHQALRVDVPVYVIFTKADMIAGFRQFFAPFDERRRRGVWGVTFQTKSKREATQRLVSGEFQRLITRLSDEVTDRLAEELDSATRISIFGFPKQMALLEPAVSSFLARVFDQSQQRHAILRGFYFTSGTQEGTPIDQVLGSIAATGGVGGIQPAFMSGRGRSYFLHDLLKKVIFAERDWVGYDRRRMFWRVLGRGLGVSAISLVCLGAMGTFAYSFWMNASLVRQVEAQTTAYATQAAPYLSVRYVDNAATRPLLPSLNAVRAIPTGYGYPRPQTMMEQWGLSRRDTLRGASVEAYSESLERLLRPRMMLMAERQLAAALTDGDKSAAYRALKVYILLAKEQDGRGDDLAIQNYFAESWAKEYATPGLDAEYRAINAHLAAMLSLDDRVSPPIKPNKALVDRARSDLADLPLAERVYSAILDEAAVLSPLRLVDQLGGAAAMLRTQDGRPSDSLAVPGLFTFQGYWEQFQQALAAAPAYVEADAWVLDQGLGTSEERAGLVEDVHALYAEDFEAKWTGVLGRIAGTSDPAVAIPLAEVVTRQTGLSRALDPAQGETSATILAGLEVLWASTPPTVIRRRAEEVQRPFASWNLLMQGVEGTRPVDRVLEDIAALPGDPGLWRVAAARAQTLPPVLARLVGQAGLLGAQTTLETEVVPFCQERIAPFYPFAPTGAPPLPIADFAAFFAYDGRMDRFWSRYAPSGAVILPVSEPVRSDFAAVEDMRAALFVPGGTLPDQVLSLSLTAVSTQVDSVMVDLGGDAVQMIPGGAGVDLRWPSGLDGMELIINEGQPDAARLTLPGGPWALVGLMARAQDTLVNGGRADVSQRIGAHVLQMSIQTKNGRVEPFTLPFWQRFTCPEQLD